MELYICIWNHAFNVRRYTCRRTEAVVNLFSQVDWCQQVWLTASEFCKSYRSLLYNAS